MNVSENVSVQVPREFLAVILAGIGNEMLPLSSNFHDQPTPKALLPVGNKPMIYHVLNLIEESTINDVLIVCPLAHKSLISKYIGTDSYITDLLARRDTPHQLNVNVHAIDGDGTCTVLRHLIPHLTNDNSDIVLLPCDIIPPSHFELETLLNKFRVERSTDGALLTSLFFEHKPTEKGAGHNAWAPSHPPLPVIFEQKTGTLLHVDSLDEKDMNEEEIDLRMGMLWQYPRTKLSCGLIDAHVYVFARTVLDVLSQKPHFASFREEFIPWLCKVQYQRTKREKYGRILNPLSSNQKSTYSLALQHSTTRPPLSLPQSLKSRPSKKPHTNPSSEVSTPPGISTVPSSPTPDTSGLNYFSDQSSLRCGIMIVPLSGGYMARAHNLYNYMELNKQALRDISSDPSTSIHLQQTNPPLIDPKSSTSDSLLGDSARVGERTSVKKSIVGSHCIIGKNVKITGSVLLDHCVVDDGVKVEGCILGNNTRVREGAEVVRCATQAGYDVQAGATLKEQRLGLSDWTEEGVEDSEEDAEEDDESAESS